MRRMCLSTTFAHVRNRHLTMKAPQRQLQRHITITTTATPTASVTSHAVSSSHAPPTSTSVLRSTPQQPHQFLLLRWWCLSKTRRRPCWATFYGLCIGVVLCVLAGTGIVLCRPYDTPPYLIPYYLRDVRSRFQHYASVRKRKGGPMYMTVEDFVLALLASPKKELPDPAIVADLRTLFESMDANGDSYISFPEFRFLMSLLTSDAQEVATLFKIVNVDGSDGLTLEDFANVLRGVTKDEGVVRSLLKPSTRRNGIVKALFGDAAHPRKCTFDELNTVVHTIRTEVWKAEFRQYDVERHNSITADEFAELIAQQVLGSHLPYYLVSNIRKMRGTGDVVTLDMWIGFNEVMLHASELSTNVEMLLSSGMAITKADFCRLMRVAGMPALPRETVDIVFAVFDKNNDGTMEIDEFLFIMRKRMNYHYSVPPRGRKTLPRRFLECAGAALTDFNK